MSSKCTLLNVVLISVVSTIISHLWNLTTAHLKRASYFHVSPMQVSGISYLHTQGKKDNPQNS
jgi:hypothetical protein